MGFADLDKEKELLKQIAKGDEDAFRTLMSEYSHLLVSYIIGFTKSQEHSEEIVQDIFLQIWVAREEIVQIKNIKNYLFVISRNYALNAVRAMVREKLRFKKWQELHNEGWVQDQPMGDLFPAAKVIEKAILQLPAQQQRAWLLSRKEGLKYREIAEIMNLSQETVKKYIQYANINLIRYIKSSGSVLFPFLPILFS